MVQYDVKDSNSVSVYSSNSNDANSFSVWHKGLDHLSDSVHKCISVQFPFIPIENNKIPCHICHFAKQRKMPFHNSSSQSTSIFELLHADIWGAYPIASVLGHKYFLTLVDDYSSFTWVILMKNKDETQPLIFLLTLKMFHFKVCFRPMNVLASPDRVCPTLLHLKSFGCLAHTSFHSPISKLGLCDIHGPACWGISPD